MSSPPSALIETLANHGVEVIFSLSGNQIMPLYDACIDSNIRIIHTRHEASAVYMAEAYAQMSGKIGVALVTAGPGLLNAVSALYSAARSESPVLLISGDAALSMDGRGGFQGGPNQCDQPNRQTWFAAKNRGRHNHRCWGVHRRRM